MNTAQKIQGAPAISAGFNLDDFDDAPNNTRHKVVVREDIEGNPISGFFIVGKDSPECQAAANTTRIDNIKRSSKRNKQIDTSTDDGANLIARTVALNEKTMALAVVVDWFGFDAGGKAAPFDKSIVEKMFTKYPTWQAKVLTDLDVDANFIEA